ncbi:hypothetical protein JOQ06_006322 [Pogonophryne albipinna]|uniref:Uncharacterized protein n=1 Tax=Pogonophryne albipinna TaxID=1090488 RepID=A0AAD6BH78_9TELE|nr:hypothetical protein JOQ06_006322 [Pogonophryne albipinna]
MSDVLLFELQKDTAASNDPFAPGGTTVNASSDPDPFAAVFGNESFGGGFADFSALTKSNGADQFGINNKNLFQEESQSVGPDVPPALPPKTGTPTRPPPPPPGKRSSLSKTESSESFQRRGSLPPAASRRLPLLFLLTACQGSFSRPLRPLLPSSSQRSGN